MFDREKKLKGGGGAKRGGGKGKKEKKIHTQLPGFDLAFLRQLLAVSRVGNLTTQPRKQNTRSFSSLNIISRSRNPPSEKKHFSRGFKVKGNC